MVEAVLLDADGVLQRVVGGWRRTLERLFAAEVHEVLPALAAAEAPSLRGETDFLPALADLLQEWGIATPVEEVYAQLWLTVETDAEVLGLVHELHSLGTDVHLASNQHARRAAHMDQELGYARLFAHRFYSCDLGLVKPDPAYFDAVVERLGLEPGRVLFVDDNAANVEGARCAGLRADRWDLDTGLPALRAILDRHGLSATVRGTA